MRLAISVDLKDYAQGSLAVRAEVRAGAGEYGFTLAALAAGDGVSVSNWAVTGGESRVEGDLVSVTGASFVIRYDVEVRHRVCLGSGKDTVGAQDFSAYAVAWPGKYVAPVLISTQARPQPVAVGCSANNPRLFTPIKQSMRNHFQPGFKRFYPDRRLSGWSAILFQRI